MADETSKKTSSTKILVVEDNKVNTKVLLLLLEPFKFKCETVENGREAVEAVRNSNYNLILMDCHMPKMDGFEATQIIRQQEQVSGGHKPIIAVTALNTESDKKKCLDAGMDDHISKPIDRQILYEKLNYWLKKDVQSDAKRASVNSSHYEGIWLDPEDLRRILEHFGDENFDNLLRNYLTSARDYITSLEELVSTHDTFQGLRVLQELNSASADVGARSICKFCRELIDFFAGGDWVDAQDTYENLKDAFQEFAQFLEEKLKTR